mmetsp:Transcript_8491/g.12318  ORF Transcript_8491/g.12318 Transcript_8491/m.12318 type:complete len:84 (-) Transcript_8491:197-448(-)
MSLLCPVQWLQQLPGFKTLEGIKVYIVARVTISIVQMLFHRYCVVLKNSRLIVPTEKSFNDFMPCNDCALGVEVMFTKLQESR